MSILEDEPLIVPARLAAIIGLNEAMILHQIHYWNKHNRKVRNNFRDGEYWTFNSYENWQKQFPFLSISTIRRTIANLQKMDLIIVGNYNKLKIDKTKWYRVNYTVLNTIEQM